MLEREDIKKLFMYFQIHYGHKWTSNYDDPQIMTVAVNEWHRVLAGFRLTDLERGLDAWTGKWPPSIPEFVELCTPDLKAFGFNVEQETAARLPAYEFRPKNSFDEMQRQRIEAEIREQVITEFSTQARRLIAEQGIQAALENAAPLALK